MSVERRRKQLRALLAEDLEREYQRYIDLCLVWELPGGDTLYVGGGQWDCEEERYTDRDPEHGRVIQLQESQVDAARWLAWWMQERRAGRDRDFITLQMMGDRGAGKTHMAADALTMLAVEAPHFRIPDSIGWMVSKSFEERDELDRELKAVASPQWYRYVEEKKRYTFVNGSTITNVSADDPDNLKRGRVDWLLLNEIQKLGKRAYLNGLARIKDKGGFSVLTGNWPTDRRGQWIYELDEKRTDALKAGKSYPIRLVKVDSKGNATLDAPTAGMVDTIVRDLDPRLAATDLDGLPMPVTDVAYWEWDKHRNAKPRPDSDRESIVRDITAQFTAGRTFRRQGYEYVIGCDFQEVPMVAVVHKIFGTVAEPVAWAVDELIRVGTEEDLIDELRENGYTPDNSLIVGDGSGRWQDGKHIPNRRSFPIFRAAGYNIVGPVKQKDAEHRPLNPKFDDRCKLTNWMLGKCLYMVDPRGTPNLVEGLKKCELKSGKFGQARPGGEHAHITDAAGYVCWWLYPDKGTKRTMSGGKDLFKNMSDAVRMRAR